MSPLEAPPRYRNNDFSQCAATLGRGSGTQVCLLSYQMCCYYWSSLHCYYFAGKDHFIMCVCFTRLESWSTNVSMAAIFNVFIIFTPHENFSKQLISSFWIDSSDSLKEKEKVKITREGAKKYVDSTQFWREYFSVCNICWDSLSISQTEKIWQNRRDARACLQNVKVGHMPQCKPEGTCCICSSAGLEWAAETCSRLIYTSSYKEAVISVFTCTRELLH